jgi:hypothetical protein
MDRIENEKEKNWGGYTRHAEDTLATIGWGGHTAWRSHKPYKTKKLGRDLEEKILDPTGTRTP